MQMFTIHIIPLKQIWSHLYRVYLATQVFMVQNKLKVIRWHLKHSIIDCHSLAILKTLDNLGFSRL